MSNIPSLDLSNFLSENQSKKNEFVETIGKAFNEIGFIALKGHFLSKKSTNNLYLQIRKFFELPIELKSKYEFDGQKGQRGYTSFGKEHAKGKKHGDLKEFWHFGQYLSDAEYSKFGYPKNLSVKEIPEFNKIGKLVYKSLEKTALNVLRATSLFLNLEFTTNMTYTPYTQISDLIKSDILPYAIGGLIYIIANTRKSSLNAISGFEVYLIFFLHNLTYDLVHLNNFRVLQCLQVQLYKIGVA